MPLICVERIFFKKEKTHSENKKTRKKGKDKKATSRLTFGKMAGQGRLHVTHTIARLLDLVQPPLGGLFDGAEVSGAASWARMRPVK